MSKLQSDDWVFNQALAESLALEGIFERLFEQNTSETVSLSTDLPSFVILKKMEEKRKEKQ
jgi:hypothetical protein